MQRIAVIVAHSDDEVISVGGLLYKCRHTSPIVIHTSRSSYNNYEGISHRSQDQVETETRASMDFLGIPMENVFCLNYPTKQVPYNCEIIEQLDMILTREKIDTIITHNPDDDHHDHSNTARAALSAARRFTNVLAFEPIYPANSRRFFTPNVYVDISGDPYKHKVLALMQHKSQVEKYGPKWFDTIDAVSRLRGIEIGAERGECLTGIRLMMAADRPLDYRKKGRSFMQAVGI